MRLINTETLAFEEFIGRNIPKYAILSHTWEDGEVSYKDYLAGAYGQQGYKKIQKTCELARRQGIGYAWVDTCCIDKSSSAELSEAINSMYRWYERSEVCYAFLSDLSSCSTLNDSLGHCRWFTRGWTLQELIAPKKVVFLNSSYKFQGSKASRTREISTITGIDYELLIGKHSLSNYCVATKMSWASRRETTRIEDTAYCLLGIFDLNMPLLYGEEDKAFRRLQEEIIRSSSDMSIFAWKIPPSIRHHALKVVANEGTQSSTLVASMNNVLCGMLAESPAEFFDCGSYEKGNEEAPYEFTMTNIGIRTRVRLWRKEPYDSRAGFFLSVNCISDGQQLAIRIRKVGHGEYLRQNPELLEKTYSEYSLPPVERRLLTTPPGVQILSKSRFGSCYQIQRHIRRELLQLHFGNDTAYATSWPVHRYDEEENCFFVCHGTKHDFGSLSFVGTLRHHQIDGTIKYRTYQCMFWASGWSKKSSGLMFGIVDENLYYEAFSSIQQLVTDRDYGKEGFQQLLEDYKIPMSNVVQCGIPGSDDVISITVKARLESHPDFAEELAWNIEFSHRI